MFKKVTIAMLIACVNCKETTRLLVELCRHGDRASKNIYPLTVNDPTDNFQTPYELTMTGAEQHYRLGNEYVRPRYVIEKEFLSEPYDATEIYVQTTYKQRTIDSADSQLDGLFNLELAFPNGDFQFVKNTVPDAKDFDLHLTDDNCQRFD